MQYEPTPEHVQATMITLDGDRDGRPFPGYDPGSGIALALSIASWLMIPALPAIAALFVAAGAKRRIRHSQGALVGYGMAKAAQIIAIVNLVVSGLLIWIFIKIIEWIF